MFTLLQFQPWYPRSVDDEMASSSPSRSTKKSDASDIILPPKKSVTNDYSLLDQPCEHYSWDQANQRWIFQEEYNNMWDAAMDLKLSLLEMQDV